MDHQTSANLKESAGVNDLPQGGKIAENADVSVKPAPEPKPNPPSVTPAAECRRSSRKKIIKFDVRDLLNKNRKPHKIQIEARIDSNVPNVSKSCGSLIKGEAASTSTGLNVAATHDLSSKQKAFMEKSAIFRRFSISQDQSKPPPPPPIPLPPTILNKVCDKKDGMGLMNVTGGKRLNRSQEYYKNALLKPKHTASLIVAQVESNVRSVELKTPSTVNDKTVADESKKSRAVATPEVPQQKKRGRPPKIRLNESGKSNTALVGTEKVTTKLSPEKAKNWKEYKACLAEQLTKKDETSSKNNDCAILEAIPGSLVVSSPKQNKEKDSDSKIASVLPVEKTSEANEQIKSDSPKMYTSLKSLRLATSNIIEESKSSSDRKTTIPLELGDSVHQTMPTTEEKQLEITLLENKPHFDLEILPQYKEPEILKDVEIFKEDKNNAALEEIPEKLPIKDDVSTAEETNYSRLTMEEKTKMFEEHKRPVRLQRKITETNKELSGQPLQSSVRDDVKSIDGGIENSSSDSSSVSEMRVEIDKIEKDQISSNEGTSSPLSSNRNQNDTKHVQQRKSLRKRKQELRKCAENFTENLDPQTETTKSEAYECAPTMENIQNTESTVVESKNLWKEDAPIKDGSSSPLYIENEDKHLHSELKIDKESNDRLEQLVEHVLKGNESNPNSKTETRMSTVVKNLPMDIPQGTTQGPVDRPHAPTHKTYSRKYDKSKACPLQNPDLKTISDVSLKLNNTEGAAKTEDITISVRNDLPSETSKDSNHSHIISLPEIELASSTQTENISLSENLSDNRTSYCMSPGAKEKNSDEVEKKAPKLETTKAKEQKSEKLQQSQIDKADNVAKTSSEHADNISESSHKDDVDEEKTSTLKNNETPDGISQKTLQCGKEEDFNAVILPPTSVDTTQVYEISIKNVNILTEKNVLEDDLHSLADSNLNCSKNETVISSVKEQSIECVTTLNKIEEKYDSLPSSSLIDVAAAAEKSPTTHKDDPKLADEVCAVVNKAFMENKVNVDVPFTAEHENNSKNRKVIQDCDDNAKLSKESLLREQKETDNNTDAAEKLKHQHLDTIQAEISKATSSSSAECGNNKYPISQSNTDCPIVVVETIKSVDESAPMLPSDEAVETITLPPECPNVSSDVSNVKKKRTRKSRFKNLHGPDSEQEGTVSKTATVDHTLSSEDNTISETTNAEVDLSMSHSSDRNIKFDDIVKGSESTAAYMDEKTIDATKGSSCEPSIESEKESTNAYVIKNLSIETNTLLDILRTVQSNEEAAVWTKKLCDDPSEENRDCETASNADSTKKCKSRKKLLDSDCNSPCRSDSNSPLTLRKNMPSPCRSNTASPLSLKKSNSSPSRSDTSSPLSLNKKITRRYERRSRRGEEPTHKTLEETFAEIAALSSKAVLEMSTAIDDENQFNAETNQLNEHGSEECEQLKNQIVEEEAVGVTDEKNPTEETNQPIESCKIIVECLEGPTYTQETGPSQIDSENSENTATKDADNDTAPELVNKNLITSITEKVCHPENKQEGNVKENVEDIAADQTTEIPSAEENFNMTSSVSPKQKESSTIDIKNDSKESSKKSSKKSKIPEDVCNSKIALPTPKRGRKPKSAATVVDTSPSPVTSSGGKKKLKKVVIEENTSESKKDNDEAKSEIQVIAEKSVDDKIAKKKRQRKLKEAFEAALSDRDSVDYNIATFETPSSSPTLEMNMKKCVTSTTELKIEDSKPDSIKQFTAEEAEEDPDPLKDIEKFIEDGVNLLKKAYKIDEDSVDNVIIPATKVEQSNITSSQQEDCCYSTKNKETTLTCNFETPADTPITTPSVTPPPKSPDSSCLSEENSSGGVRRSHRIKLITKTPKALVGRGLVRDKERFSIKDDVETKSHYTLDDHLLDLAEVEAKNAKFLKEMEERLSNFQVIKENEYKCERVISREARKMICDCFLTAEEAERGELACGEDCLNRLLMIECGPECNVRERCTNKRFQKLLCSPCRVFRTEKKGFGIMADIEILPGEFIMEYVGEVIDTEEFERRRIAYSQDKNRHYYFMALRSDAIIDATIKGNISRFINHSCDPNAETQKWTVNGELRIGFFSRKSVMPGEEITFNYQYQRYGREAQRCYCESANCRGWIGQEPTSDEGEQIDDEDDDDEDETDEEEDEDEENTNLLEDDEESDASVSDPEIVQKKLELAAAQAAAELDPIKLEEKSKVVENIGKEKEADTKSENEEEDSKSKFKKLLSKMAEKVAAKNKQSKKEQKLKRKKKTKESNTELANKQRFLEDPDIEDEVEFLSRCGLKNQSDTLRLSRLMVRAKLVQTRLNLLDILRKGELPCRRLFLDYHGLRLVHGWMSEDAGNMQIRLALLQTLELLPIVNKTMLTDSKVMQVVRSWCGSKEDLSPNEDSQSSNSNSQDCAIEPVNSGSKIVTDDNSTTTECDQLQKLALKLVSNWEGLPEIFRIPKKERIEQMKEHEREADRQYAEIEGNRQSSTDRFGRRLNTSKRFGKPNASKQQLQTTGNPMMRTGNMTPENLNYISKAQRREMFAAKVARDEAEKRMAEERREFETKCRFFGLDPKKTRPQDVPFCVNPATGQWYSVERKPITTPPSYAHVQVAEKQKSTNPVDYQLPAVCSTLPPRWKYAITPLGQIYYYHVQYRVPQWEPPSASQLHQSEISIDEDSDNEETPTTGPESSDDDDEILVGMDAAQLKAYIDRKVETRRQKRYQRLVGERAISPRREEDRVYNQLEVRKYKENKEKIRKRKEEIRRKRAEALRQSALNMCTLGSVSDLNTNQTKSSSNETEDNPTDVLPIQDYLISSDEDEEDIKIEVNSPLIDKIVEGDKIVDELDALTTKKPLKRSLPPHRDLNDSSSSNSVSNSGSMNLLDRQEYKKRKLEKKDKRKSKEQDIKYRKTKEKFRCEIAGIIVHHLKPYRKDSCSRGRIQSNDDFNHLARKLTHFVMIKELKYCESVGQTLVVTESVKNKSREFIKKYMSKYGEVYVKPSNDPEFKDIPFTL